MVRVEVSLHGGGDSDRVVAGLRRYLGLREDAGSEAVVLEAVRRGATQLLQQLSYSVEVTCSHLCSQFLAGFGGLRVILPSQNLPLAALDAFLRDVASAVGRMCSREDFACNALNISELEAKLNGATSEVDESMILDTVGRHFYTPSSIEQNRSLLKSYALHVLTSVRAFLSLVAMGVPPADASYALLSSAPVRLVIVASAADLIARVFPELMCPLAAPREVLTVAWRLWLKLETAHPAIFCYTGPRCVMLENVFNQRPLKLRDVLDRGGEVRFTVERCPMGVPRDSIGACIANTYRSVLKL